MNNFKAGWCHFWVAIAGGPLFFVGFLCSVLVFTVIGDLAVKLFQWLFS